MTKQQKAEIVDTLSRATKLAAKHEFALNAAWAFWYDVRDTQTTKKGKAHATKVMETINRAVDATLNYRCECEEKLTAICGTEVAS